MRDGFERKLADIAAKINMSVANVWVVKLVGLI